MDMLLWTRTFVFLSCWWGFLFHHDPHAHFWTDNSTGQELWFISVTQHNNFESIIPILQGKLAFKTVIYTSSQSPEKIHTGCFNWEIQKSFSCIKYFRLEKKVQRTNHWIAAFVTVLHCLHSGSISVHENSHGQVQNRHLLRCYPERSQYLGPFLEIDNLLKAWKFHTFAIWFPNAEYKLSSPSKTLQLWSDEDKCW